MSAPASWFSPEDFEADDFDAGNYVAQRTRLVPIEMLQEQLQLHSEQLKSELVDVINDDYSEFMALSETFGDIDGAVLRIKTPLLRLQEELAAVQLRYQSDISALEQCLQRQSQVSHAKTMLELIQDANAAIAKVEGLIAELPVQDSSASSPHSDVSHAKHIERCANELSRLQFYVSKGAELPLVSALQPRADAASAALTSALRQALSDALVSDSDKAAQRCMHACSVVNDVGIAHECARSALVQPALVAAATNAGVGRADSVPFATLLDAVKAKLGPVIKRLAALASDKPDLASCFDVLGTCCLAEVHAAIKEHMPGAFATSSPAAFFANYQAGRAFLQWLEAQAPSHACLQLLRDGAHRAAFLKAWNLAVYFSLVFQEVAGALEQQLHSAPTPAAASKFQRFAFSQSDALFKALTRCRDPAVTFPAVFERFFKLQLQLVVRYAAWLQEGEGAAARISEAPANGAAAADASQAAQDFGGFDSGGMKEWLQAAEQQQLVQLLAEIGTVVQLLRREEAPAIAQQMGTAASDAAVQQVSQACESAIQQVEDSRTAVCKVLTRRLSDTARPALLHVRSTAATYRMANRPDPTKASHYVASLLKAAEVASLLAAACTELLESVAKTQASLSRFRRTATAPGGGSDGAATSLAKVQKQLQLDVDEFGAHIARLLGCPADSVSEFRTLQHTVQGQVPPDRAEGSAAQGTAAASNGHAPLQSDTAATASENHSDGHQHSAASAASSVTQLRTAATEQQRAGGGVDQANVALQGDIT